MADDINLPDLISHLGVDLTGLSGTVADASRQGSSVGAALGGGIQRELRDLLAHLPTIDVDASTDDVDRDLARVREQLDDLADQRIGVDVSIADALRRLEELEPHLQRLSDTHPNINVTASTRAALRQLEELRAAARQADDADVDIDVDVDADQPRRLTDVLSRIPAVAGRAAGALSGVARAGVGIGAVVPLVAGVATTLANIAPAAAVGVTGLAAVQLASGTLKLAMVGVEDAISAALDPSKAEEFNEALEKLSPEARKFATAVRDAAPALRDMQQDVQNEVFRGLGDNLERLGKTALPVLRVNLLSAGIALNGMAVGTMNAAQELAENGTLGKALGSASTGLNNLSEIPGVVVTALGQIGAAAGPSFERLTERAGKAAEDIGKRLDKAFESGRMQEVIEDAIDLLGDLWDVGENVAEILGDVFGAVPEGGGLIGVLEDITSALAEITGTDEFQEGLEALFETVSKLGETAAPLLAKALALIAPILTELAPPVQELIEKLGEGLTPILDELERSGLLEELASGLGDIVSNVGELLPPLGELVAAVLPLLVPLVQLTSAGVRLLGEVIDKWVVPAVQALAALLRGDFSGAWQKAQEAVGGARELIGKAASKIAELIGWAVNSAVDWLKALPGRAFAALSDLAPFLASRAREAGAQLVAAIMQKISEATSWIRGLPGRASAALSGLPGVLRSRAGEAGRQMVSSIAGRVIEAVGVARSLPGRVRSALGGLGNVLYAAGRSLVAGFVSGMFSMMGQVASAAGSIVGAARDYFPFSPAKKGPFSGRGYTTFSGEALIRGFEEGILAQLPRLRAALEQLPGVPELKRAVTFQAAPSMAGLGGLALPTVQQLQPVMAGGGGGDQYNEIHLHGTRATPRDMIDELSWLGLVGRK